MDEHSAERPAKEVGSAERIGVLQQRTPFMIPKTNAYYRSEASFDTISDGSRRSV